MTDTAGNQLRAYIERIERLNVEKTNLTSDIRDIFSEAESHGYDPKIMREVIKLRTIEKSAREYQTEIRDVYLDAMGMAS